MATATEVREWAVAEGKARIRAIVTSAHSQEILERSIDILTRVGKRMNILKG